MTTNKKASGRVKRALRVRHNLKRGSAACPRMTVFKSNRHLAVQLIDDEAGRTIAGISTSSSSLRGTEAGKRSRTAARKLGEIIAEKAKAENIQEVVFDRGCYKYHGLLAELADAARAGGLRF